LLVSCQSEIVGYDVRMFTVLFRSSSVRRVSSSMSSSSSKSSSRSMKPTPAGVLLTAGAGAAAAAGLEPSDTAPLALVFLFFPNRRPRLTLSPCAP
jgi:hypothetical protein